MKTKYHYTKQIIDVELYFREVSGNVESIGKAIYEKLSEEDKKNITVEKVSILKPWWALSSKIERMSINPITQNLDNILFLKNQILYYLKTCSMVELKFVKDQEGDEKISNLNDVIGESGLSQIVVSSIVSAMISV